LRGVGTPVGEIPLHRDPPDAETAEPRYGEGLALAAQCGMHPLVACCHLGLGTVFCRTRELETASVNLTALVFGEMGMRFWLEQEKQS